MQANREHRTRPIPVRFSPTECRSLKEAADREHMYVSSYIRTAAMAETERRQEKAASASTKD